MACAFHIHLGNYPTISNILGPFNGDAMKTDSSKGNEVLKVHKASLISSRKRINNPNHTSDLLKEAFPSGLECNPLWWSLDVMFV